MDTIEIKDSYDECEYIDEAAVRYFFDTVATSTTLQNIFEFNERGNRNDYQQSAITTTETGIKVLPIVGEVKGYFDPKHPRPYGKHPDYMIDFDKVRVVIKRAKNAYFKSGIKTFPILIVFFLDCTVIWDLSYLLNGNSFNDKFKAEWRLVNKDNVHYGEKEWEYVTYLKKEDGRVYRAISRQEVEEWIKKND